jgi:hypothetical protein
MFLERSKSKGGKIHMADKVIFELTAEVADKMLEKKSVFIDYEHLPFDRFIIAFPTKVMLTAEQVLADTEKQIGRKIDPIKDHKAFTAMKEYAEKNLSVVYNYADGVSRVDVYDPMRVHLFSSQWLRQMPIPQIHKNEFSKDGTVFAFRMMRLVSNVLDHVNSPVTVVTKEREEKKPKKGKGKSNKKSGGKQYIYKTVYKIEQTDFPEDRGEAKHYQRHTESWNVRRHPRHYRNPDGTIRKTIWIEPQVRGKGREVKDTTKNYKITRVEG